MTKYCSSPSKKNIDSSFDYQGVFCEDNKVLVNDVWTAFPIQYSAYLTADMGFGCDAAAYCEKQC